MIAIVDYAKGNLQSVYNGLCAAGAQDVRIVTEPVQIEQADAVVLPGVGAFADASASMTQSGQMQAVRQAIQAGKPYLGICLGLHMMFEGGTEHAPDAPAPGLGVAPGIVDRIPSKDEHGVSFKVPHVGWNTMHRGEDSACPLFDGIDQDEYFYFTHSYVVPSSPFTQATTTHATEFPCVVQTGPVCFGVQFHPEKSSDAGLHVLRNFVTLAQQA